MVYGLSTSCPGNQKPRNPRTGILTGGELAKDFCQGRGPARHGTEERHSHVKELRRSCHHPAWDTGPGCWLLAVATARHCWSNQPAATLHGSATGRPLGAPRVVLGPGRSGLGQPQRKNPLERHGLHFEKQNHICKRDSASKSGCARKAILEELLTLHLA